MSNYENLKEDDLIRLHNESVELERSVSADLVMLKTRLQTEEEKLAELQKEAHEKFGVSSLEELRNLYQQNLNHNRSVVVPVHQSLTEISQIVGQVKKELQLG